jgi:hypothetical protein
LILYEGIEEEELALGMDQVEAQAAMEEMETVLYSITLGPAVETSTQGKAKYQAFSAAISN